MSEPLGAAYTEVAGSGLFSRRRYDATDLRLGSSATPSSPPLVTIDGAPWALLGCGDAKQQRAASAATARSSSSSSSSSSSKKAPFHFQAAPLAAWQRAAAHHALPTAVRLAWVFFARQRRFASSPHRRQRTIAQRHRAGAARAHLVRTDRTALGLIPSRELVVAMVLRLG